MTEFSFKALERNGKLVGGTIIASDEVEATRKLAGAGRTVFELSKSSSSKQMISDRNPVNKFGFEQSLDQVQLFSDLALLTGAGLTVSKALETLAKSGSTTAQVKAVTSVLNALSAGSSAFDSFAKVSEISKSSIALIASGENSRKLPQVFSALAEQLRLTANNKAAVISALAYPLFLIVLMFTAFSIVIFVLVPALEPAFENSGKLPPQSIRFFGAIRLIIGEYNLIILAALTACTLVFLLPATRKVTKELAGSLLVRAPWIGSYLRKQQLALYLCSLSMMLENGVVLSRSLELANTAVTQLPLNARLEVVRKLVTGGTRLPEAYEQQQIFDARILSVLAVGFEAGKTAFAARQAAHILEDQSKKSSERFLAILTPAITIFIGLAIGGLILSVMTALLSINELAVQ